MKRRYRIVKLNSSSAKYGDCEICGKLVTDMQLQVTEHESSYGGWIYGKSTFGHKDCLLEVRR